RNSLLSCPEEQRDRNSARARSQTKRHSADGATRELLARASRLRDRYTVCAASRKADIRDVVRFETGGSPDADHRQSFASSDSAACVLYSGAPSYAGRSHGRTPRGITLEWVFGPALGGAP